jgi:glycosyltransferase involved in cell wall biosynthesis
LSDPTFTILLPVHRAPVLLPLAVGSVLAQTLPDFELFIIADGAPPETLAAASALAAQDRRIRLFDFPKGARHGEAHRHEALRSARGRYICQIADDDLWFPNHLLEMSVLLAGADFGNLLHCFVTPEGEAGIVFADLADPAVRDRMLAERHNIFGPTAAGYRLSAYRRLDPGWSPAPEGLWTDLFMWRKFLGLADIAVATRFTITSLHFPASLRMDWPLERRREEMERHAALVADPAARDRLRQQAFSKLAREKSRAEADFERLRAPPAGPDTA